MEDFVGSGFEVGLEAVEVEGAIEYFGAGVNARGGGCLGDGVEFDRDVEEGGEGGVWEGGCAHGEELVLTGDGNGRSFLGVGFAGGGDGADGVAFDQVVFAVVEGGEGNIADGAVGGEDEMFDICGFEFRFEGFD